MKKEIRLKRSIWPDIDGPEKINEFLKNLGIEVKFLLDDGILFLYPSDSLEPYKIGEGTLFFKDSSSKEILFHYYEDISDLVFEIHPSLKEFRVPIFSEEFDDFS